LAAVLAALLVVLLPAAAVTVPSALASSKSTRGAGARAFVGLSVVVAARPHHAKHRKPTPAAKAPKAPLTTAATSAPLTAAPLSAAAIAACPGAGVAPNAGNLADVAAATSCLVNQVRAEHGLTALVDNSQLDAAAELHNADMIDHDYFAQSAGLASQVQQLGYISDASSQAYVLGQSIAVGVLDDATPIAIVDRWLDSPGVVANILNPGYRASGVAVAAAAPASISTGLDAGTYTEDFGAVGAGGG
jgi:uncharacterized protein YkwD